MMDTVSTRLPPKAAVEAGFKFFRELFTVPRTGHVLLEGLEFVETDDAWRVTIGFDAGRNKETGGPLMQSGLGQKTIEPIREFRAIYVDSKTGDFIRAEGV